MIGVRKNNKFKHPNDIVLSRLENIKTKVFRTDEMGQISIIVESNGNFEVKKYIE